MSKTLILGAGFSVAVNSRMPLTDELGSLVFNSLSKRDKALLQYNYRGARFEAWLSRLAEPQPDLDSYQNLKHKAAFQRISEAVAEVIRERQLATFREGPPWWLQRFVGAIHHLKATVITFNYDTLVERTVDICRLRDAADNLVSYEDALRSMPQLTFDKPWALRLSSKGAVTFRLIKMHGSVDTYWIPDDATGTSINRWNSSVSWTCFEEASEEHRRHVMFGREPFIVPPSATKSSIYANPLTRELWRDAASAIGGASELALLGYSLPLSDLTVAQMLSEQLQANDEASVSIVNLHAEGVHNSLTSLGVNPERIRQVGDGMADALKIYTDELEMELRPDLSKIDRLPVLIRPQDGEPYFECLDAEVEYDISAKLLTIGVTKSQSVSRPLPPVPGPLGTLQPWRQNLLGLASIIIIFPGGDCSAVASTEVLRGPSGAEEWLLCTTTAVPFVKPTQ